MTMWTMWEKYVEIGCIIGVFPLPLPDVPTSLPRAKIVGLNPRMPVSECVVSYYLPVRRVNESARVGDGVAIGLMSVLRRSVSNDFVWGRARGLRRLMQPCLQRRRRPPTRGLTQRHPNVALPKIRKITLLGVQRMAETRTFAASWILMEKINPYLITSNA